MSLVRCFSVSLPAFFLGHRVHHCEKERERKRKRGQSYLSFIRPFRDRPMAGGNKDDTGRTAKSTSRAEKRTNAADCRAPFFLPFLPPLQQLLPLPSFVRSFVRSPARSSVRPSSSFSLFLSLRVFAYKAIPRVPSEKSRNPRCRTLGTRARPLADLE